MSRKIDLDLKQKIPSLLHSETSLVPHGSLEEESLHRMALAVDVVVVLIVDEVVEDEELQGHTQTAHVQRRLPMFLFLLRNLVLGTQAFRSLRKLRIRGQRNQQRQQPNLLIHGELQHQRSYQQPQQQHLP